jgi:O-antigen/teichoic acid export membrane protein
LASYGDIAIGLSWANYASVIVQYAFHLTGPKYIAQIRTEESRRAVFWNVFAAKLLLFFLVFIVASVLVLLLKTSKLSISTFLLYSMLPLGSVFHAGWYLQAVGRFMTLSVVSFFAALVSLVIGFGFVVASGDGLAAVTSLTIGLILSGVGTFIVSSRMMGFKSGEFVWQETLRYLHDGWLIFFSQLIASLYMLSGPIVIGQVLNSQAAGAYSVVERIVISVSSACLLTHTAAYPRLARLYHIDRSSYRRLMTAVLCIYLVGALFFCAVVALAGESFTRFIFGGEAYGYGVLVWWGMVLILLGIFGPMVTGYLVVSGHQDKVYPLTIKILIVSIVLGIPGIFYFGAWAWFCSLAIAQTLVLWAGYQALRK